MIDRACAGIDDPAEMFAVSVRITGRLGWTHPDLARFLVGAGLDVLDQPVGLGPRALRDIKAGQAAGRFTAPHAEVELSADRRRPAGTAEGAPADPNGVDETAVDQLAEPCCACSAFPTRRPAQSSRRTCRRRSPGDWRLPALGPLG